MNLAIARRKPRSPPPRILSIRSLTHADLEYLRQPSAKVRLKNIREVHHQIARLFAAGLTNREIAYRLGYTEARISTYRSDPSMMELSAHYHAEVHESWRDAVDEANEYAIRGRIIAERQLVETLTEGDEDPDKRLPAKTLLQIAADRQDRFGVSKKSVSVNVNLDFAKKLEQAIAKSKSIRSEAG
jgi:hypothetical protein